MGKNHRNAAKTAAKKAAKSAAKKPVGLVFSPPLSSPAMGSRSAIGSACGSSASVSIEGPVSSPTVAATPSAPAKNGIEGNLGIETSSPSFGNSRMGGDGSFVDVFVAQRRDLDLRGNLVGSSSTQQAVPLTCTQGVQRNVKFALEDEMWPDLEQSLSLKVLGTPSVCVNVQKDHLQGSSRGSVARPTGAKDQLVSAVSGSTPGVRSIAQLTAAANIDVVSEQNQTPLSSMKSSSLLKGRRASEIGNKLRFFPNIVGKVTIPPSVTAHEEEWKRTLIACIGGKFPGMKAIRVVSKGWKVSHKMHHHESGWVVIVFDNVEDMEKVLYDGPYTVHGRPFVMKRMPKFLNYGLEEMCFVPVWVKLPNLPKSLWGDEALAMVCSILGKPLHTDMPTASRSNRTFARVQVEINISKDLLKTFPIEVEGNVLEQRVIYEKVPLFCEKCGKIGHKSELHDEFLRDELELRNAWRTLKKTPKDKQSNGQQAATKGPRQATGGAKAQQEAQHEALQGQSALSSKQQGAGTACGQPSKGNT